jgi:DNA-binding LacI/PurR family transcriptional regulator
MTIERKSAALPRNARMIDVARLAGVSHQTVSRVLNDSPLVSQELRERVNSAIRLLGYKRNHAARALVTRRTMNLGVVCFGISQFGPSTTLHGMAETAHEAGYATSLVTVNDTDRESVLATLEHLESIGVDGIAVIAPVKGAMDAVIGFSEKLPLIAFEPGAGHGPASVSVDEVLGARMATRHLLSLGHETVWHVSGPAGWLGTDARIRGWREELSAEGRVAEEPIAGDWSAASGQKVGAALARNPDVTAIYAANDQMALGVVQALEEHGRRVPQDVSIVGFDDIPEAAYFRPSLTTVRLDFAAVGRLCVNQLLKLIAGEQPAHVPLVPPELRVRSSAAPPWKAAVSSSLRRKAPQ